MAEDAEAIQPTIAVRMPPPESRPASPDYKTQFDEEAAAATADSLRGYLIGLSEQPGCLVTVSGTGRAIECRSNRGTGLDIKVFGPDVFDLEYSPNVEQMTASKDHVVLMLLMPGYDSDHVAAYARHYLQEGLIEI